MSRIVRRVALSIALALITVAGCSNSPRGEDRFGLRLDQAFSEIDATEVAGLNPLVAKELKIRLKAALAARNLSYIAPAVTGATLSDMRMSGGDVFPYFLYWSYTNPGDLDQNSEVNISDLSPLGANLHRNASEPNWDQHRHADADGNGVVSLSDITVIGHDFLSRVEGYIVESSPDGQTWQVIATLPLSAGSPSSGNKIGEFSFELDDNLWTHTYRVTPYRGSALGTPTEIRYESPPNPHGLMASQGSSQPGIYLSWEPADSFRVAIDRAASIEGPYVFIVLDSEGDSFTDDTAADGIHYWYRLWVQPPATEVWVGPQEAVKGWWQSEGSA